jgi:hypothetical protein
MTVLENENKNLISQLDQIIQNENQDDKDEQHDKL